MMFSVVKTNIYFVKFDIVVKKQIKCGLALSFWSALKGARPRAREAKMHSRPGHEIVFVQRMLVRGEGGIAFGRWGSMYFCDVCPVHHI